MALFTLFRLRVIKHLVVVVKSYWLLHFCKLDLSNYAHMPCLYKVNARTFLVLHSHHCIFLQIEFDGFGGQNKLNIACEEFNPRQFSQKSNRCVQFPDQSYSHKSTKRGERYHNNITIVSCGGNWRRSGALKKQWQLSKQLLFANRADTFWFGPRFSVPLILKLYIYIALARY